MTPDQEPIDSRSPTTNGDEASQESVDADGVQQVEEASAETASVEQVQVDQDDLAAASGRPAGADGPSDQDLEQEEVAAQAHDRPEGLTAEQSTSEGEDGDPGLPDPHNQPVGSAPVDHATVLDSISGGPPGGAGSSSGDDSSPRAAAAATAAEESAIGPTGSRHRAETGVGWFSTSPGTSQHTEMLSEELSAERPSDEPVGASEPEGPPNGGVPHLGIGLTPVRGEHRGPELIENGMVHVDPDPEIGSPSRAAGLAEHPTSQTEPEEPGRSPVEDRPAAAAPEPSQGRDSSSSSDAAETPLEPDGEQVPWNEPALPMAWPPGLEPSDRAERREPADEGSPDDEVPPQPDPTWPRLFSRTAEGQDTGGTAESAESNDPEAIIESADEGTASESPESSQRVPSPASIWADGVPQERLAQAQDDATVLAIKAQEAAGLDIITDGEIRRESYSNRFATALAGVDVDNPGVALDRSGHPNPVPRVVGAIRRKHAVQVEDLLFLKRHTDRRVKVTVPGPFTMAQQAQIEFYDGSRERASLDYAAAVNDEIRDLFANGADIVQIDEPYMQARPDEARAYGLKALNRALDGVKGVVAVHICFGYAAIIHERPSGYSFLPELAQCGCAQVSIETAQSNLDCAVLSGLRGKQILLGVLDLSSMTAETPELVATRIRRALPYVSPEDIVVAPDCGMKYLPRDVADAKLRAMVAGARIVRDELNSAS